MASVAPSSAGGHRHESVISERAEDVACEQAALALFSQLDSKGTGYVLKSQVLPLWPALSRHIEGTSAESLLIHLRQSSAPIHREDWMALSDALRAVVGPKRFRHSLKRAEAVLAAENPGGSTPGRYTAWAPSLPPVPGAGHGKGVPGRVSGAASPLPFPSLSADRLSGYPEGAVPLPQHRGTASCPQLHSESRRGPHAENFGSPPLPPALEPVRAVGRHANSRYDPAAFSGSRPASRDASSGLQLKLSTVSSTPALGSQPSQQQLLPNSKAKRSHRRSDPGAEDASSSRRLETGSSRSEASLKDVPRPPRREPPPEMTRTPSTGSAAAQDRAQASTGDDDLKRQVRDILRENQRKGTFDGRHAQLQEELRAKLDMDPQRFRELFREELARRGLSRRHSKVSLSDESLRQLAGNLGTALKEPAEEKGDPVVRVGTSGTSAEDPSRSEVAASEALSVITFQPPPAEVPSTPPPQKVAAPAPANEPARLPIGVSSKSTAESVASSSLGQAAAASTVEAAVAASHVPQPKVTLPAHAEDCRLGEPEAYGMQPLARTANSTTMQRDLQDASDHGSFPELVPSRSKDEVSGGSPPDAAPVPVAADQDQRAEEPKLPALQEAQEEGADRTRQAKEEVVDPKRYAKDTLQRALHNGSLDTYLQEDLEPEEEIEGIRMRAQGAFAQALQDGLLPSLFQAGPTLQELRDDAKDGLELALNNGSLSAYIKDHELQEHRAEAKETLIDGRTRAKDSLERALDDGSLRTYLEADELHEHRAEAKETLFDGRARAKDALESALDNGNLKRYLEENSRFGSYYRRHLVDSSLAGLPGIYDKFQAPVEEAPVEEAPIDLGPDPAEVLCLRARDSLIRASADGRLPAALQKAQEEPVATEQEAEPDSQEQLRLLAKSTLLRGARDGGLTSALGRTRPAGSTKPATQSQPEPAEEEVKQSPLEAAEDGKLAATLREEASARGPPAASPEQAAAASPEQAAEAQDENSDGEEDEDELQKTKDAARAALGKAIVENSQQDDEESVLQATLKAKLAFETALLGEDDEEEEEAEEGIEDVKDRAANALEKAMLDSGDEEPSEDTQLFATVKESLLAGVDSGALAFALASTRGPDQPVEDEQEVDPAEALRLKAKQTFLLGANDGNLVAALTQARPAGAKDPEPEEEEEAEEEEEEDAEDEEEEEEEEEDEEDEGVTQLRRLLQQRLLQANSDGRLAQAVENTHADYIERNRTLARTALSSVLLGSDDEDEDEGPADEGNQTEEEALRVQALLQLCQAAEDGTLEQALELVRPHHEEEDTDSELVREKMKGSLMQASADGRLNDILEDVRMAKLRDRTKDSLRKSLLDESEQADEAPAGMKREEYVKEKAKDSLRRALLDGFLEDEGASPSNNEAAITATLTIPPDDAAKAAGQRFFNQSVSADESTILPDDSMQDFGFGSSLEGTSAIDLRHILEDEPPKPPAQSPAKRRPGKLKGSGQVGVGEAPQTKQKRIGWKHQPSEKERPADHSHSESEDDNRRQALREARSLKRSQSMPSSQLATVHDLEDVSEDELRERLQTEMDLHKQTYDRMKELEKRVKQANQRPKPSNRKFGVAEGKVYENPPVNLASVKEQGRSRSPKSRGVYAPPLQSSPPQPTKPREASNEERRASSVEPRRPDRVLPMSRAEASRSRLEAIAELEKRGLNTWEVRRAEKVARYQDMQCFGESMWDSFFDWKLDARGTD